jgi:hypothetical protein
MLKAKTKGKELTAKLACPQPSNSGNLPFERRQVRNPTASQEIGYIGHPGFFAGQVTEPFHLELAKI